MVGMVGTCCFADQTVTSSALCNGQRTNAQRLTHKRIAALACFD